MITTRAMPAPLPAHHRRVAEATIKNDFADALGVPPRQPRADSSVVISSEKLVCRAGVREIHFLPGHTQTFEAIEQLS